MIQVPLTTMEVDGFYHLYVIYDYAKIVMTFRLTDDPILDNHHMVICGEEFENVARVKTHGQFNGKSNIIVSFEDEYSPSMNRALNMGESTNWVYKLDADEIHAIIAKHI